MKYFKKIVDLPCYDLYSVLEDMKNKNIIDTNTFFRDQICLNSIESAPDNVALGRGSLYYDWDNLVEVNGKMTVPLRDVPLEETDFTVLCNQFKGTEFEDVYNNLSSRYVLGRVRIMRSKPKTCMTWHVDTSTRIHYPVKTQEGCFMVIEDEVMHIPNNTWWWTDTIASHTAFNGSSEDRLHLVAVVLGEL
jgi:hypothetical protein